MTEICGFKMFIAVHVFVCHFRVMEKSYTLVRGPWGGETRSLRDDQFGAHGIIKLYDFDTAEFEEIAWGKPSRHAETISAVYMRSSKNKDQLIFIPDV